ncbi:Fe(3+)-hydroxamate ABC transporter permease FhuB [Reinekea thalattae]|uniref:Fe(3+)-hydroxamate ABC transporter permease FhuB n=1 Tax=Reinekea thalattae TaxID=2593301 RepID=A0A5C8ZB34_9GAMM|nr:Fe(3+)-hydroxamate ABC transporter permease FhuB [Reinekea thalattae]TXR54398.1 Fe(3+)-hydroxamate ABC transporter permease FhuB [Reinekea thalattae]
MKRTIGGFLILSLVAIFSLQVGIDVAFSEQLLLIKSALLQQNIELSFDAILMLENRLPRLAVALFVGATLGIVGSLMQQLTQNPLVSPLTLGTASGAWLALVIGSIWLPVITANLSLYIAMFGAMLALVLVILIAGFSNLSGLPIVLAGLAVNILFGSIATAIILLHNQYATGLFIWGAGDLEQNGWQTFQWLAPRLSPLLLILVFAPRVLMLLRLGQSNASARGLSLIPAFLLLFCLAIWSLSVAIASVGVISFIGLLAPNASRLMGARLPRQELVLSAFLGAAILMLADSLAIAITNVSTNLLPTGVATAMIGAPALIYFSRVKLQAKDNLHLALPDSRFRFTHVTVGLLVLLLLLMISFASFIHIDVTELGKRWQFSLPGSYNWSLRWPRMLTAISAGSATAVAGVLLQRLIYNPLASPDVLGISAGATLMLVAASIFFGHNIYHSGPLLALLGSALALLALILLARKQQYAPSIVVLIGISIGAMIEALVHFCMARGDETSYNILAWLAGSTYRVSQQAALLLAVVVGVILALVFTAHRWLTLISGGRSFAHARGLNVQRAFLLLLCAVALLVALVTSVMGPVAFVGLLAPHIAVMLGARKVLAQLICALLVGANLMLVADTFGQLVLYPAQIAAGTIVAIIGGCYFIFLLLRSRLAH